MAEGVQGLALGCWKPLVMFSGRGQPPPFISLPASLGFLCHLFSPVRLATFWAVRV